MLLRTFAVALIAICPLLAAQTAPPGSQPLNPDSQLPTSLLPTPLARLSNYPLTKGK